jgi:hypothetical protein
MPQILDLKPIYKPLGTTSTYIDNLVAKLDKRTVPVSLRPVAVSLIASLLAYRGAGDEGFRVKKSALSEEHWKVWQAITKALTGTVLQKIDPYRWKVKHHDIPETQVYAPADPSLSTKPFTFRVEGTGVRWSHPEQVEPDLVRLVCGVEAVRIDLIGVHHAMALAMTGQTPETEKVTFPPRWNSTDDLPAADEGFLHISENHVQRLSHHLATYLPRVGFAVAVHHAPKTREDRATDRISAFVPVTTAHLFRDAYAGHTLQFFHKDLKIDQFIPVLTYTSIRSGVVSHEPGINLTQQRAAAFA